MGIFDKQFSELEVLVLKLSITKDELERSKLQKETRNLIEDIWTQVGDKIEP